MCGIVGMLSRPGKPARNSTAVEIRRVGEVLTALEADLAGELPAVIAHAAEISASLSGLRGFDLLFQAGLDAGTVKELRALEERFRALQDKVERAETAPLSLQQQEALNRVRVLCQDARWQIDQDVLAAAASIQELNGGPWREEDRERAHHLWRIDYLLRNIGRIEVRGRDSAGISLLAAFRSPELLAAFLDSARSRGLGGVLDERRNNPDFSAFAVIGDGSPGYIFTYKVAREIGKMGDNMAKIRADMKEDPVLRCVLETEGVVINVLSHTRWASNGVISEPNAHPQDNRLDGEGPESGRICAVLNGDIDNFQALLGAQVERTGRSVSAAITTDAKIIPLVIGENYSGGWNFLESFRRAVNTFEGSFAIAAHHLDEPDKIYLALHGSGQSLYVGIAPDALVAASELYGVVESTSRFIKMNGEWTSASGAAGQILVLDQNRIGEADGIQAFSFDGSPLPREAIPERDAEITTRDIRLGEFSHYFLKEIHESVSSVEKTLRGRFSLEARGEPPRFLLDESVLPNRALEGLRSGDIKRVYCIGQGTAAVAARAAAHFVSRALESLDVTVTAARATELSGYLLADRMDDILVIAISQSGTTADTNRTVDLVRSRGACCIGIINRRNSDLAYKCDGVLYTSDGRDIEMAVASTKAFYSQVAAGYLLALHLGARTGSIGAETQRRGLEALIRLPAALRQVLALEETIAAAARTWAPSKLHWAVVGSGLNHVAAEELRIKLSELCYKSIACDYLEDKKHIDLSSEPLILVCAAGLDTVNLSDAVKEVAIFKAHRSVPIVLASDGIEQFAPYAAETIACPPVGEGLDFVPEVMAGHLFGFHAALAIDALANDLRSLRTRLVEALGRSDRDRGSGAPPEDPGALFQGNFIADVEQNLLLSGRAAACLDSGLACRLALALRYLQGKLPLDDLAYDFGVEPSPRGLLETGINTVTAAVNQLTRPIDAIKHQAKTVTVGISREELRFTGMFARAFADAGVRESLVSRANMEVLRALEPLVAEVSGFTQYVVTGLGAKGRPGPAARVRRLHSGGLAAGLRSRTDGDSQLRGTKWLCVKERSVYLGKGRNDGRSVAIVPLAPASQADASSAGILLLHLAYVEAPDPLVLTRLLTRYNRQYDRIVAAATELNMAWNDRLLLRVPVVDLFDESLEPVLEALRGA